MDRKISRNSLRYKVLSIQKKEYREERKELRAKNQD